MSGCQRCECLKSLSHRVIPFAQDDYINRALPRTSRLPLQGESNDDWRCVEADYSLRRSTVSALEQIEF